MLDIPAPLRDIATRVQAARDAGDGAALAALYSEDATILPPSGERLVGRAAIAAWHARPVPKARGKPAPSASVKFFFFPPLVHAIATVNGRHGEKHSLVDVYGQQADGSYAIIFSSWTMR